MCVSISPKLTSVNTSFCGFNTCVSAGMLVPCVILSLVCQTTSKRSSIGNPPGIVILLSANVYTVYGSPFFVTTKLSGIELLFTYINPLTLLSLISRYRIAASEKALVTVNVRVLPTGAPRVTLVNAEPFMFKNSKSLMSKIVDILYVFVLSTNSAGFNPFIRFGSAVVCVLFHWNTSSLSLRFDILNVSGASISVVPISITIGFVSVTTFCICFLTGCCPRTVTQPL